MVGGAGGTSYPAASELYDPGASAWSAAAALAIGRSLHTATLLASGKVLGGGPTEALNRILNQQNLISEMEPGLRTNVEKTVDWVIERFLGVLASLLPDFGRFSFADYVASGFNISGDTILTFAVRALAFVLPVFVAAYLCLKNREVAK